MTTVKSKHRHVALARGGVWGHALPRRKNLCSSRKRKPKFRGKVHLQRAAAVVSCPLQRADAAMATFEEQTQRVVEALFSDLLGEDESDCRSLEMDSGGPVASAEEPPTSFDAVVVASRLRRMGDQCNMDFERVSSEALAAVLKGKVEKFPAAVESLSRSWSNQNPELVYERAFLCVSVKLLMYVAKKVSAMVHPSQLISMINGNSQVRSYIEGCGGWENLDN